LEVRQNYVTVHAEEDYKIKKTLGELEKTARRRLLSHRQIIYCLCSENQPVAGAFARRDGAFTAEILLPQ
jgi:hypothetical protein